MSWNDTSSDPHVCERLAYCGVLSSKNTESTNEVVSISHIVSCCIFRNCRGYDERGEKVGLR